MPETYTKSGAYRLILDTFRQMYGNAQIMALADYTSTDLILTIPGTNSKFTFKNLPVTGIEQGDLLYVDSSGDWIVRHHGNAGDILFSGGHGVDPYWTGISAIDHGGLSGLADNDHPQYQLRCGVSDRTATLSYSSGVFTATHVTDYDVWTNGVKWTITNNRQVNIDNDNTLHYVYFDIDGVMKVATSAWNIMGDAAPFALVFRISASLAAIGDERHTMDRNRALHKMLHESIGARYDSLAGGLTGTFSSPPGFSISTGYIWDEDLEHTITGPKTACRIWYRNTGATAMTFLDNQSTLYKLNGSNIQYDSGGTPTDASANRYVCHYVFATNDVDYPIYSLLGQTQHTTIAAAQNESTPTFAGLTTVEWKLLYKVIYQNTGGTPTYTTAQDYRNVSGVPISFTPTSHASLSGLDSDDHTQYLLIDGTRGMTGAFKTDHIAENTAAHGIILDNDVTRVGKLSIDHIGEATGAHTIVFDNTITVGNTGLIVGASTPFSDSSGTLTLQNIDAIDATTETTIETAIDTLANLTSIQGQSVTLAGELHVEGATHLDQDLTSDASPTFNQGNFTTVHTTTILADHIGEHTGAHTITFDNTITASLAEFSSATAPVVRSTRTSSGTNTGRNAFAVRHLTSGDMVDGLGPLINFQIQDSAGVDNSIGDIGCVRDGADNSGALVFYTSSAGTETAKMKLTAGGCLNIGSPAGSPHPLNVASSGGSNIRVLGRDNSGVDEATITFHKYDGSSYHGVIEGYNGYLRLYGGSSIVGNVKSTGVLFDHIGELTGSHTIVFDNTITNAGQSDLTTVHSTTLLVDHIGEHTSSHKIVFDNALSLSTDLAVTDGGTGASTLTDHGVLVGSGADAVTALTVGTNGQVLVGSTGADPVFATITDGEGIDTTLGAGALTIACETTSTTNAGVIELATQAEVLAGTDTSRAVVPVDLWAKTAIDVNPKAFAQGINMTYASSGSTGITVNDNDNIDFGTGNFTLVWKGSLPDWTPSASVNLLYKYQGSDNQWWVYLTTAGKLGVYFRGGASATINDDNATVNTWTDGTAHEIAVVVVRETASTAGSVTYYADGVPWGVADTISAGSPADFSNTGALYILGTATVRYASTTSRALTYNRALSAAEVLSLYQSGVADADKWGSQTATYTSDFSAGADSFGGTRTTLAGNIDSIGGQNDNLRAYATNVNGSHPFYRTTTIASGKKARVTLSYYLPSGQTNVTRVGFLNDPNASVIDANMALIGTTTDAWTTVTYEYTNTTGDSDLKICLGITGNWSFVGANSDADDRVYIRGITVTQIGATLALEPEGIQSDKWYDSSTNALDASYPTTGSNLILPARNIFKGGNVYIGDTSNANVTLGLTLNQGSADDTILAFKSSDVAHSMTGIAEADSYGRFLKASATLGGLAISGFTDADADGALILQGMLGAADPTDTNGAVILQGYKYDGGTSVTSVGAAETVLSIKNSSTKLMTVLGTGHLLINDTANSNVNIGITINQGAYDDTILALKSSDVAHSFTTDMETDTYATFRKISANRGGLEIISTTDDDWIALHLKGCVGISTAPTYAPVMLAGAKLNGTTAGVLAAGEKLFALRNHTTDVFAIDASGNVGIGAVAGEVGATNTLNIPNGTAPDAHVDNQVILYSADSADATATLALYLEQAVEDVSASYSARKAVKLGVNGTMYWVNLIPVTETLATHAEGNSTIHWTAGENVTTGQACYLKSDGKLWKAKSDATTTMPGLFMAMESINADAAGQFLRTGIHVNGGWSWTVGAKLYVSPTTAGSLTETAPTTSGHTVQIVAFALSATTVDFRPMDFIELV